MVKERKESEMRDSDHRQMYRMQWTLSYTSSYVQRSSDGRVWCRNVPYPKGKKALDGKPPELRPAGGTAPTNAGPLTAFGRRSGDKVHRLSELTLRASANEVS